MRAGSPGARGRAFPPPEPPPPPRRLPPGQGRRRSWRRASQLGPWGTFSTCKPAGLSEPRGREAAKRRPAGAVGDGAEVREPEDPRRKAVRGGVGEDRWGPRGGTVECRGAGGQGAPSGAEQSASRVLTCRGAPRTGLRLRSTPAGPVPPRREAWCGPRESGGGGRGWDGCTCLGPEVPARGPCPLVPGGVGSCGRPAPRPGCLPGGRAEEKRRLKGTGRVLASAARMLKRTGRWSAAAARAPSTLPPGGGARTPCPPRLLPSFAPGFYTIHDCRNSHFYFDAFGTHSVPSRGLGTVDTGIRKRWPCLLGLYVNWQVHSDKSIHWTVYVFPSVRSQNSDKAHVSEMLRATRARGKEKRIALRSRGQAGADRLRRERVSA